MSVVAKVFRVSWVALALQLVASAAAAQTGAPPAASQDLLLLITEKVDGQLTGAQAPTLHYWWEQASAPKWSASDTIIRQVLGQEQVGVLAPSDRVQISKIYRRPELSAGNAATLGELVGARKVLVGTISYTLAEPVELLGLRRVSAFAEIQLMPAESGASPLQRFVVEREAFSPRGDEALEQAREALSQALGTLVAATIRRGSGPVGVQGEEGFIGLRNAENAGALEAIMEFLEGLDVVKQVSIRWASEGLIALEINPGTQDSADTIEYAIRALGSQSFEAFTLAQNPRSPVEGMIEFEVAPGAETSY